MGTSHLKSTLVTNSDALPKVDNNSFLAAADLYETIGTVLTVSADASPSTYCIGRVRSSARVSDMFYQNDAMTAGVVKIGVANAGSNGQTLPVAASDQIFASGVSFAAAHNVWTSVLFPSILGAGGLTANLTLRVWELLGLAADPFKDYDVVASVTTSVTTGATFAIKYTQIE
jgi:hypothetical protein